MRENFKARSVWSFFALLLYASVLGYGKRVRQDQGPAFKDEAQGSSNRLKGGMDLSLLKIPKVFKLQPSSNEEIVEVVDEDKVRSSDTDIGPAEPVSDSLVEIVHENGPNISQKGGFSKRPLGTRNSSLSLTISKFPEPKVHALPTHHRKPRVKLKQKFATGNSTANKAKIVTRVSIPGKHILFNISHSWSDLIKLLSSRKFSSRRHNTYGVSALQLNDNINPTNEARKRNNQTSSRDAQDAFVYRMGLNRSSNLDNKPSLLTGVSKGMSHWLPFKNALSSKGSTDLSLRKVSLQRISTNRTNVRTGKPTSVSDSSQDPSVTKGVPLEKTEKTTQLEPEVLSDTKLLNSKKHLTSKGRQDNAGSHDLAVVDMDKNATYLNNTNLSTKPNDTFALPLNPNISKHFDDLINFFNSFKSSSSEKPTTNTSIQGNNTSENLVRFLDFIHVRKSNANYTSRRPGMTEGHTHSNHGSIAEQNRKRLQKLIYKGWNEVGKERKPGVSKLLALTNSFMKNKHVYSNPVVGFGTNDSSEKNKGNSFELNALQMMRNVSKKELLKLEGDIIDMLSSARLLNLSQENGKQNSGQQHQVSLEKLEEKHQQLLNRHHDKQDRLHEERLEHEKQQKQQQQLHSQTQLQDKFQHRNLIKVGQQQKQNQTQGRKNQTDQQQIQSNNDGTTLLQHRLNPQSEQSHVQETNQSRQILRKMNMSLSTNSTTTVQNCTLPLPVNATNKHLNYACYQTYNRNSKAHKNGSAVSFQNFSNTSQADADTFNETEFHKNSSHNSTFGTSPLVYHKSTRKKTGLNSTSLFRTANSTVKRPGNASSKEIYDTRNISIQLDRDLSQKVNNESISEEMISSGVEELTEFVDQVPDKETPVTRWSEWTSCSKSCGDDANRKRIQYQCTSSSQEIRDCAVNGEQHEICAFKPCPVDGRFSSWSLWSSCSRSCGFKGFSARTRSCYPPRHGGQPCYGSGIDTRKCNRKHCPVNGGLSKWSNFGLCSKSCGGGVRMRHRECNNPVPRYGGAECDPDDLFETQSCGNMKCPAKTLKRLQVADVDPKSLCDFNPCEEAGCLHDPAARCITDFECNPVFFNIDGDMLPECKGIDNLYSRIPHVICSYNPCLSETCWEIRNQCVVDLKCRPVFIGIDRRSIPPQCQVHGTVRVDRVRGDLNWNKISPVSRQASVNLASDSMPSFTQLWFPVVPSDRIQQFERMTDASNYQLVFSRKLNTYSTNTNRLHTVQPVEQKPVTEVFTEKLSNNNDDDDDEENGDDADEDNADEDDDDGNVLSDFDEDNK